RARPQQAIFRLGGLLSCRLTQLDFQREQLRKQPASFRLRNLRQECDKLRASRTTPGGLKMLARLMNALRCLKSRLLRHLRLFVHTTSSCCQVCRIRFNIRWTVTRVQPSSVALSELVWPSSFN